jgi:hypothetical protein
VHAPLEVVALDDERPRDLAVARSLPLRPDVDEPGMSTAAGEAFVQRGNSIPALAACRLAHSLQSRHSLALCGK